MLSYLISKGFALFVAVPFILLLWIATCTLCFLFYKLIKGDL